MSRQASVRATRQAATAKDASVLLQRKCACGTHTIGGAECDGCRGEGRRPRRAAVNRAEAPGAQTDAQARPPFAGGLDNDLSRVPASSTRAERGAREFVSQHRHVLNASVRRVPAAPQNDSTGDGVEQKPAAAQGAKQSPQTPAAPPPQSGALEPKDGETRSFSHIPEVAASESQDPIAAEMTYTPSVKNVKPPPSPGQFGKTSPFIAVNRSSATAENKVFKIQLVVDNKVNYWVDAGGRTDIASDADADITQTNYTTVATDLTPAPKTLKVGNKTHYKNQPQRTKFWAEDLTLKHERFHAAEDVKFGKQGAVIARDWLNTQTAAKIEGLDPLVQKAAEKVADKINLEMAEPRSEEDAYNDGAPDYTARAQAIKTKGDANGYAAKPPAQQNPNPPAQTPNSPPQTPTPPPSAAPKAPEPKP